MSSPNDKKAGDLFLEGYNCAQAVFAANATKLGLPFETALKLSAPLGGGVGRMRNVCGAFSACAMLMGLKESDASNSKESKALIYKKTQELAEKFKAQNGSIICAELLKLEENQNTNPTPDERDSKYYATRPCLRIVEKADALIKERLGL